MNNKEEALYVCSYCWFAIFDKDKIKIHIKKHIKDKFD